MRIFLFGVLVLLLCPETEAQEAQTITINGSEYSYSDPAFELLKAAFEGDINRVIAFLDLGADVNTTTWDGVTPLMYAAQEGHLKVVELLLKEGANVNTKPFNQVDALLGAVIAGHVFVSDTLILNGADINTRNIDGVTPLMYAAAGNNELMADMLLFYGADVSATDHFGNQAIHLSTFYDGLNATQMLLERGANSNAQDIYGFSPLMIAAQNGYLDHAILLTANGAEVNAANIYSSTALALAITNKHFPVVEYLVANGAETDHQINDKVNIPDLVSLYGNHQIKSYFESMGITRQKKLRVDQIAISAALSGNNSDLMLGGEMGVHEMITGLHGSFGYMTRPAVRSVLYEVAIDTMFQYWESRSYFHLGADKFITLRQNGIRQEWRGFAGLHAAYSYGNFRGSGFKPDDRIHPLFRAGLHYAYRPVTVRLNYEYLKFKPSKASPHRVSISFGVVFGMNRYKMNLKSEPRL
jgi:ankyrin repeat protein